MTLLLVIPQVGASVLDHSYIYRSIESITLFQVLALLSSWPIGLGTIPLTPGFQLLLNRNSPIFLVWPRAHVMEQYPSGIKRFNSGMYDERS